MSLPFHANPVLNEASQSAPILGGKKSAWVEVDAEGRLTVPASIAMRLGLKPGARVRVDEDANSLRLHRPVTHLAKVYVEPMMGRGLDDRASPAPDGDTPMGRMTDATFEAVLASVRALEAPPVITFGGTGEPLSHPRIVAWVKAVKSLGCQIELITRGTLLDTARGRALIEAGLDTLWVTIGGPTPELSADARPGAELTAVIANLERFRDLRPAAHSPKPEIGLAFVAMKRNIAELPALLQLGLRLGARRFSVSNALPVTADLQAERLFTKTTRSASYMDSARVRSLSLPRMDFDETTRDALFAAFNSGYRVSFGGSAWSAGTDVCDFIESGSISLAWNGDVSPCWPLMRTHTSYLHGKPRVTRDHILGNVRQRTLLELWLDPEYVAYRERVHSFGFPPCSFCGGCDLSESNVADCFENPFPACGACLWAQGVLQSP